MTVNFNDNPIELSNQGDGSWSQYPNQKIFVKRIDVYGGTATGTFLLLDHQGHNPVDGGMLHAGETQNARDPNIILHGDVAASTYTSVEVNQGYRGLYLDDIPAGARLMVYIGAA